MLCPEEILPHYGGGVVGAVFVERLGNEHTAKRLNCLRASGLPLCLLVNFQRPKVEWKRTIGELLAEKQLGPQMNTDEHGSHGFLLIRVHRVHLWPHILFIVMPW